MIRRIFLVCILVLVAVGQGIGEEPDTKSIEDAPQAVSGRTTAVAVEHEGSDAAGAKLALELKDLFNSSTLFQLTDKDTPKLKVFLSTVPEFPNRPEVGSVFAVVWVYSESERTLKHYLGREVGVVSDTTARAVAQRLGERTDRLASNYAYLFDK